MFGAKFLSSLVPFDLCVDADGEDNGDKDEAKAEGDSAENTPHTSDKDQSAKKAPAAGAKKSDRKIWGMVSKAGVGVGRADNDRQFLYLNGRPVDLPKVTTVPKAFIVDIVVSLLELPYLLCHMYIRVCLLFACWFVL